MNATKLNAAIAAQPRKDSMTEKETDSLLTQLNETQQERDKFNKEAEQATKNQVRAEIAAEKLLKLLKDKPTILTAEQWDAVDNLAKTIGYVGEDQQRDADGYHKCAHPMCDTRMSPGSPRLCPAHQGE